MAIWGCNLAEVRAFVEQSNILKTRISEDEAFRKEVLEHGRIYNEIKKYFCSFTSFLRYGSEISGGSFYRVRKAKDGRPYGSRKELVYPDPSLEHKDRMNNTSFRVLYTSFHEFTAMAETRIGEEFIGQKFQLTRFTANRPLKVYRLGFFSELYSNSPRDSDYVKGKMRELFGADGFDRTIKGYSALECAMSDILYDQDDGYHILSSILADAIFSTNEDIDAIAYPSMQNRYGVNFAFKKESADLLQVSYSCLNKLTGVHNNGFFEYLTEMECFEFNNSDSFSFESTEGRVVCR
ncbi:RES domain protein [Pseudomonas sp. GM41(2012)]|uniref:RES family NAD+ phosphorylase n=1 Tax=Pseudomonas sp. (strain GM41(2012)) TaxID=1144708 RepID=UPI0002700925|nr:RES family NAD+ phosphorylase [Pseudomonas sp. GM41(2012)]EUB75218.1 RES domain protein [Pseudomonas sp. GM41(2012)]